MISVKISATEYKQYGLIGETNGLAWPIGFMLTAMTDSGTTEKGAKEHMLDSFLPWFVKCFPKLENWGEPGNVI